MHRRCKAQPFFIWHSYVIDWKFDPLLLRVLGQGDLSAKALDFDSFKVRRHGRKRMEISSASSRWLALSHSVAQKTHGSPVQDFRLVSTVRAPIEPGVAVWHLSCARVDSLLMHALVSARNFIPSNPTTRLFVANWNSLRGGGRTVLLAP
jgi:hypothetical protein